MEVGNLVMTWVCVVRTDLFTIVANSVVTVTASSIEMIPALSELEVVPLGVAHLMMKMMKHSSLPASLSEVLDGRIDCDLRLLWQLLAYLSQNRPARLSLLLENAHLEILVALATHLAEPLQELITSRQSTSLDQKQLDLA